MVEQINFCQRDNTCNIGYHYYLGWKRESTKHSYHTCTIYEGMSCWHYLIRVTRTSISTVASVLKRLSNLLFPSLFFSDGSGSCPSFRAAKTIVEGTSTLRSPPFRIPIIPSSRPGNISPLPTVKASSLKSVSSFVEKYFTPPGSFAVENDLQRIVISTATLEPG